MSQGTFFFPKFAGGWHGATWRCWWGVSETENGVLWPSKFVFSVDSKLNTLNKLNKLNSKLNNAVVLIVHLIRKKNSWCSKKLQVEIQRFTPRCARSTSQKRSKVWMVGRSLKTSNRCNIWWYSNIFQHIYIYIFRIFLFGNRLIPYSLFPQQRKLIGSSAQISSGVCRCWSQEQVPEGSGRLVPEGFGRFC